MEHMYGMCLIDTLTNPLDICRCPHATETAASSPSTARKQHIYRLPPSACLQVHFWIYTVLKLIPCQLLPRRDIIMIQGIHNIDLTLSKKLTLDPLVLVQQQHPAQRKARQKPLWTFSDKTSIVKGMVLSGCLVGHCYRGLICLEVVLRLRLQDDAQELIAINLFPLHEHVCCLVEDLDVAGHQILCTPAAQHKINASDKHPTHFSHTGDVHIHELL